MTSLGELCHHIRSHVKPSDRPNDTCLGLADISSGRLTAHGSERAADTRSTKSAFMSGDILYGKLRPNRDRAVLATTGGICTTELLVLRPKQHVSGRYLVCMLHTPSFVQHAISGMTGERPRTSWDHIRRYRLPTYGYEEQEEIADYVWKIESTITANLAIVREGTQLVASAIDVLFGGVHDTNSIGPLPANWSVCALGDLCNESDLVSVAKEGDRSIEYVDVSSICRQSLRIKSTKQYRLSDAPSRAKKRMRTNDVLFATVRPALMRIATVPPALDNQVCSTAFCVLRPNTTMVEPRFIYYIVQRRQFVQSIGLLATGASYPAVTDRMVLDLLVPVPPIHVQREIVNTIDAIRRTIDVHSRKIGISEELRKRVLLDYVRGRS